MDAAGPQVVPFGADGFILALLEPVCGAARRVVRAKRTRAEMRIVIFLGGSLI